MANRITAGFARMKAQIADRIANGLTTAEKVRNVHKTLDMDLTEYVKFQTLKTLAVAQGLLTPEEGQSVYVCLGESVQTFNEQPIHVKSVLTSLFGELLTAQMRQRSSNKNANRVRRRPSAASV
jgi:hypothetical protein